MDTTQQNNTDTTPQNDNLPAFDGDVELVDDDDAIDINS
jgi:hypothetical protein